MQDVYHHVLSLWLLLSCTWLSNKRPIIAENRSGWWLGFLGFPYWLSVNQLALVELELKLAFSNLTYRKLPMYNHLFIDDLLLKRRFSYFFRLQCSRPKCEPSLWTSHHRPRRSGSLGRLGQATTLRIARARSASTAGAVRVGSAGGARVAPIETSQ